MIFVKNLKTYFGEGYYIGRKSFGYYSSIFRNRFLLSKDLSRSESLEMYEKWFLEEYCKKGDLFDEFERLVFVAKKEDLFLLCWCDPLPCHGNILKKYLEARISGKEIL